MLNKIALFIVIILMHCHATAKSYAPVQAGELLRASDVVVIANVVDVKCNGELTCSTFFKIKESYSGEHHEGSLLVEPYNMFEKNKTYLLFLTKNHDRKELGYEVVSGGRGAFEIENDDIIFDLQGVVHMDELLFRTVLKLELFLSQIGLGNEPAAMP